MKVGFHTLGCKVNQYETEAMKEQFAALGYEIVGEEDFADVYVINTCTVTNLADRKSRQYIRRRKKQNPDAIMAVTGCYAQVNPGELEDMEEVDIVAGTGEKNNLAAYIEQFQKDGVRQVHVQAREDLREYQDMGSITSMESRTRAYIKIEEGCDRFCAYCMVPFARGQVRSRPPGEIEEEAGALIDAGFKELILTGINTALYGADREDNEDIGSIIARLDRMKGEFRIRLSSLEPTVINAGYVKKLLKYDKLCHHMHLSVQSGSDRILESMNRKYSRQDYLAIVDALRSSDAGYGITTDIIAGFPGETEEDLEESLDIIKKAEFGKVHVFRYSQRPGTVASSMPQQIPGTVRNERMEKLMAAGGAASSAFFAGCAARGEAREVLLETMEDGMASGYSDNYIKVYVRGGPEILNSFKKVKLLEEYRDGMKGEIIDG